MTKYLCLLFVLSAVVFSQTETHKWEKEKTDYGIEPALRKEYEINVSSFSTLFVSTAQVTYYKLFSEYDGDNCPFHPSCSAFFVDAVRETNLLQGALMFADRFTRDTNYFKDFQSYPIHKSGQFYDPVYKYELYSVDKLVELEQSDNE